jgi:hypothetical protein
VLPIASKVRRFGKMALANISDKTYANGIFESKWAILGIENILVSLRGILKKIKP